MSYQYVPGLVRVPRIPNMSLPDGVWRGKGADEWHFAFPGVSGSWGRNVIVEYPNFCPNLVMDGGGTYSPVFSDVNGYIYWRSGSRYIYHSTVWGWVHTMLFPGYEPVETSEYDSEKGETVYSGDHFYTVSSLPSNEGQKVNMTPRGVIRNQAPVTLEATWERWVCDTEAGVYEAKGGASGTRILGLPQFRGSGETFLRSVERESGYFRYGRIHRSQGKWVIGEIGSASGWHEGSEPKADGGAATFRFCRPEGSDAEGSDISVSFDRYVLGDATSTGYLGEVAVWR